jgi:hypothetical protein
MQQIETLKRYFDAGEYLTTYELEALHKAYSDLEAASKVFGESATMSREWAIRGSIPVADMLRARNVPGY